MDIQADLALTKAQYLSQYPSPSGRPYDKLVVGAIIFNPSETNPPRLLLLKRVPHEKQYPNVFEIPGGHVEDDDYNILGAIRREVREETAIAVHYVLGDIDSFSYSTEKVVKKNDQDIVVKEKTLQLNFVCKVMEESCKVNPEEHSEGVWATEKEAMTLQMTDEMRVVVGNAFKWRSEIVSMEAGL